ncbi:MAG: hypothetical protein HKO59_17940 [Phycisphaerales bacterium]|nr:hypothetical protein [Phycisphaerales bacterium]NNM27822.1 hypothetical protein [Phycisphaerales bacterium]
MAELACDADHDFFVVWGAGTEDRINDIINQVNVQYERDVDITHEITTIIVRTEPTYAATDAWTLVNEFRNKWLSDHGLVPRDAAHLFTGKDLDGNTIGIAYDTGRICTTGAYCLAQSDHAGGFACSTDITAHELGHLWGAGHCACPSFTMNSTITCANAFSSVSIVDIITHRDTRDCLDETDPITYCSAFSSSASFEHIARFALGDIDHPSGPSTYSSFLAFSTELARGDAEAFAVTLGSPFASDVGGVWIDWNQDGDFVDADEAIDVSLSGVGPYIGVVVVPETAPTGPTRLRVRIQDGTADPVPGPCGTTSFGEVEDYTVVVTDPCPADLDGSGDVGFTDLITVLSFWGPCAGVCPADIDDSGDVGFTDLLAVLSVWGPCS